MLSKVQPWESGENNRNEDQPVAVKIDKPWLKKKNEMELASPLDNSVFFFFAPLIECSYYYFPE